MCGPIFLVRTYILKKYLKFVSYFGIVLRYIRMRYKCLLLYIAARYTLNVSHVGSLKRSLKCLPRFFVMTNTYKEQLYWHLW